MRQSQYGMNEKKEKGTKRTSDGLFSPSEKERFHLLRQKLARSAFTATLLVSRFL